MNKFGVCAMLRQGITMAGAKTRKLPNAFNFLRQCDVLKAAGANCGFQAAWHHYIDNGSNNILSQSKDLALDYFSFFELTFIDKIFTSKS